jgi:hypothetical protein
MAAEGATYLFTHYVPASSIDAATQVRVNLLLDASVTLNSIVEGAAGRVQRVLGAICGDYCPDCAKYGPDTRRRQLAADALFLFDTFLEPVEGTAPWGDSVQLELTRAERGDLVLVSKCRLHILEVWVFHNMDMACVGFVYSGPTDFFQRSSGC